MSIHLISDQTVYDAQNSGQRDVNFRAQLASIEYQVNLWISDAVSAAPPATIVDVRIDQVIAPVADQSVILITTATVQYTVA